ncbi:mitochondrial import protein Pam17-domain-containing protein [Mortierella sp. GBAus27b]|nr:TIM23 complex component [Mortierella sp. GBA43]KAI8353901.1 mitochondrial import protein Pam17-domain-containing protein [Mortierella sp. GBAus27b]
MATAALRMSFITGRAAPRAFLANGSTAYSIQTMTAPRRFLTTSAPVRQQTTKTAAAGKGTAATESMDWNTYFAFRRTRRNYERVFMAPCALLGLGTAGYYFAQRPFDPTPIFGMDQVIVYGLGTIAAGIAGLAAGPVVGNMVFRAANSKAKPLVDRMDKEFFKHIVKNRADPSANSVRNPIPDYYGEKIKSVSEYRAWLRKQREYRRKSQFYVGVD